jgi:hypothetical protein
MLDEKIGMEDKNSNGNIFAIHNITAFGQYSVLHNRHANNFASGS